MEKSIQTEILRWNNNFGNDDKYDGDSIYETSRSNAVDIRNILTGWGGLGYYSGADLANGATYSVMGFVEVSGFIPEWLNGAGGVL